MILIMDLLVLQILNIVVIQSVTRLFEKCNNSANTIMSNRQVALCSLYTLYIDEFQEKKSTRQYVIINKTYLR